MPHAVGRYRRFSLRPDSLPRVAHRLAEVARVLDLDDPLSTRQPDLPEEILNESARMISRPRKLSPFLTLALLDVNLGSSDVCNEHPIHD